MKNKFLFLTIGLVSSFISLAAMDKKSIEIKAPIKFSDLRIVRSSDEKETRDSYFIEAFSFYYKAELLGGLSFSLYKIKRGSNAVSDFVQRKLCEDFSWDAAPSFGKLIKGHDVIVELENIKLEAQYQKQGIGKELMRYFLDYVKNKYGKAVILLRPEQSFSITPQKKKKLDEYKSLTINNQKTKLYNAELQEKLVGFYKGFGAQEISHVDGWFSIDLK